MELRLKRLGVLGTMIWDTIHRDDRPEAVEEWGGIGYALSAFDAALPDDWTVVPLVKVGRDLAPQAARFLGDLERVARGSRFIEVASPNPRVTLRYQDDQRRFEGLRGGVPPWTWQELGPLLVGLDALYANFITGFECSLPTMQAVRRGFSGPIYGDLHSLALGIRPDGTRYHRPIDEALEWLTCFDVVQVNEDEMSQLGQEPLALAARALALGVGAVCVTIGPRGAVYVAAGDFAGLAWAGAQRPARAESRGLTRTALVGVEGGAASGDPTGCGDVFGATCMARLLSGEPLEAAISAANRAARRNVSYRGATGLAQHLRGGLVRTAGR